MTLTNRMLGLLMFSFGIALIAFGLEADSWIATTLFGFAAGPSILAGWKAWVHGKTPLDMEDTE